MNYRNNYPQSAGTEIQHETEAIAITASGLSSPLQLFGGASSVPIRIDQTASDAPLIFVKPGGAAE